MSYKIDRGKHDIWPIGISNNCRALNINKEEIKHMHITW
jgi:hypothetical protein